LLQPDLVTLSDLTFQLLPADFTALSERNVERFGPNYFVVHLGNGLGGLIRRRKANEAKPLGCSLLIAHDLATCNSTEGLKFTTKLLIVDIILEVLDVKVDALILAHLLLFRCFVCLPQFIFALRLLLSARNEELPALVIAIVKAFHGRLCLIMNLKVDEAESFASTFIVHLYDSRSDGAKFREQLNEIVLRHLRVYILDVQIREL
jgi:hypothetical protein